MFTSRNATALRLAGTAVVLTLAVSACSGSSKKSTSSSSSSGSASTSASGGSGTLAKANFVSQANKVCADVNGKLSKLPQPASPDDFDNVIASLNGTTELFGPYLDQVGQLAARTSDAAELKSKWLDPETKELTAFKAAAQKVVADAQAKDSAKVQTDSQAISNTQTDSDAISSYLNGYGLTECAQLETS